LELLLKKLTCLTKGNKLLVSSKEKKNPQPVGEEHPHGISIKKELNLLPAEKSPKPKLHPIGPHHNMPCKLD
jgi:hypothetical protein